MTAPACHPGAPTEIEVGQRRDIEMDVALLGRPNVGKSSLYNAVAGGDARVGNFPGITVDVLEALAELPGGGKVRFLDLPGVYSLADEVDPASDEGQARACLDRLQNEAERTRPFVVAQVIDAMQLALGLRLTREIASRRFPLVVLVTQRDVLEKQGGHLDVSRLEREIGAPVLVVSARDPDVRAQVLGALRDFAEAGFTRSSPQTYEPGALAKQAVIFPEETAAKAAASRTERIDAVLLHPVFGALIFFVLMSALFSAVFLVADPASTALDGLMQRLAAYIVRAFGDNLATSLVCDGILGGAGTVLAFLPQIVILTVALELIDASGYLARGAFIVDRLLRFAGLGGKSFVPLLTAHACAVPAIAATRIVRDPKQRLLTLLVIPLMTCSARIPTYGLLVAAFFAHRSPLFQGLVFVALYSAGILAGLLASLVIGKVIERNKKGMRSLPLVLEMPAYRLPQPRVVFATTVRTCKRFLTEVGTVIVIASVGLWVLLKVPAPGAHVDPSAPAMEKSIAASVGRGLEPVTKPLGFDWRINVGLIGSFGARELMVSTLGVTYGIEGDKKSDEVAPLAKRLGETKKADGSPAYTAATALALMAFFVLACQCMSTVAALRRETKGWRVPLFVVGYTYVAAYVVALGVHQLARLLL